MKRQWTKLVAIGMLFILCVCAATACGESNSTADNSSAVNTTKTESQSNTSTSNTASSGDKILMGYSSKNKANPFQYEFMCGVEDAIDSSTTELVETDANSDAAKQVSDIEDLVSRGCKVIFFVPYDSHGLESVLKEAKAAGVIMINLDNAVDENSKQYVDATVVSDNYQAGTLCAQHLAEGINKKGNIGAYEVPTSVASVDRSAGFFDTLKSDYPDIKVVADQTATSGTTDTALPVMEDILQANPDIVGMFGYCDSASLGCVSAIKSAGKLDQIKVVSVDGSTDGKTAIAAGELYGSAAQFPAKVAEYGVQAAYSLLKGEKLNSDYIKVPTEWCNKDNYKEILNFTHN